MEYKVFKQMLDFYCLFGLTILLCLKQVTFAQTRTGCSRRVFVQNGDFCWKIANENQISLDLLNKLNPELNCDALLPNQVLCVSPASCQKTVTVETGNSCWSISSSNGISLSELQELNPPGIDCNKLQIGQSVCVATTAKKLAPTTTTQPTNPQTLSCQKVTIKQGDTCWSISSNNGITLAELLELNQPEFDCDALRPGESVCVGKEGQSKPTTTVKPNLNCKSVTVKSGDVCFTIAQSNGLTLDELLGLNSELDCSKLVAGDRICVGDNSIIPETFSCKQYTIKSGDNCWSIATSNNLTLDQLKALNPKVDCDHLFPGQKLCIGSEECDPLRQPKIATNCKTVFSQEGNTTCGEIEKKFGLGVDDLASLNSNYSCCTNKTFVLPFGYSLCVQSNSENSKCTETYVIKPGDTCWSIWVAHRLAEWQFHALNPEIDCSSLVPGGSVCISNQNITGQECLLTMAVQSGDSCETIAQKGGITIDALQNLNKNNLDCQKIQAKQVICISNDQRFKIYERNDEGPTKHMLESTVRQILAEELSNDDAVVTRFNEYLAGNVPPEDIFHDLGELLGTTAGSKILKNLETTDKNFEEFASFQNDHRSQLCESLSSSVYKTCICDLTIPFIHCQAKLMQIGKEVSRRRRDLHYMFQNVTQSLIRSRRRKRQISQVAAGMAGGVDGVKDTVEGAADAVDAIVDDPLHGILDAICGGCISTGTACIDTEVCVPAFVIIEICLGAGFCMPNPFSLIDSSGHITVSQFEDSHVGIDLSLCLTVLNEILNVFGLDACIAKGGVDYFYLKQQLMFQGTISVLAVRGSINGRVQVAEAFTEGVYDTEAQTLLDDMCTEEDYQCEDYCQVPAGDVFLEWKVEGWLFGWHDLAKGSKNDPPPCKPKQKKSGPASDSLNMIVLYTTSWAQYRAFNATIEGVFMTRPDTCKPYARTPKDIDPSLITHLNYAFLVIDENTFGLVNFEKNDDQLIAEMNALKGGNSNLKTLISIGGWSFSQGETGLGVGTKHIFSNMARTQEGRARFIKSAVDYVISHGIDGIDIDWEYPLPEDRDSFTALLRETRSAIDATGKEILFSIAAPAGRKWYSNIDLKVIHEFVDFINLMTYDFHGGSFEAGMGPNVNAPIVDCSCPEIEDIELGLESYLAAGVPAKKINLGMATYGRTFTLDSAHSGLSDQETLRNGGSEGSGKQGVCTLTPGVLSYFEIKQLVTDDKVLVDKTLMSAYARFDSNQWVGYDTKETHDMKLCFARRKRLGGIMIWDGEMDDNLELIKNIKANIASDKCDDFEIPDCPNPHSRKKRAAIRRKPKKKKKGKHDDDGDDDAMDVDKTPECEKIPAIKNRDVGAMRKCKGTKVGAKCKVVCKENYKPTKPDILCRKVGLKRGVWVTADVKCEQDSTDCGEKPNPIIRVTASGGSTLYYARFDTELKLPIWSLYVQKEVAGDNPGRLDGFKRHNCFKQDQLLTSDYNNGGYHRGHLAPQDAFSFSTAAMKASNLMINVAPQDGSTNSGAWQILEGKVKKLLQKTPGYVVTGICTSIKRVGKLPVPDCFWKMICTKTPDGETTVGVYYHKNTKADVLSTRSDEVKKVRDQAFVATLIRGSGRSLADIWKTAAKLSTARSDLPNPVLCSTQMSVDFDILGGGDRGGGDKEKFWDDNIGSDKSGKWGIDFPDINPNDENDEEVDDEDEDEDEDDEGDEDEEGDGAGGNWLSDRKRSRCGHDILY